MGFRVWGLGVRKPRTLNRVFRFRLPFWVDTACYWHQQLYECDSDFLNPWFTTYAGPPCYLADVVLCQNEGPLTRPRYDMTHYGDTQTVPLILGNPHVHKITTGHIALTILPKQLATPLQDSSCQIHLFRICLKEQYIHKTAHRR